MPGRKTEEEGRGHSRRGEKIPCFPNNCTVATLGKLGETGPPASGSSARWGPRNFYGTYVVQLFSSSRQLGFVFSSYPSLLLGGLLGPAVLG